MSSLVGAQFGETLGIFRSGDGIAEGRFELWLGYSGVVVLIGLDDLLLERTTKRAKPLALPLV